MYCTVLYWYILYLLNNYDNIQRYMTSLILLLLFMMIIIIATVVIEVEN